MRTRKLTDTDFPFWFYQQVDLNIPDESTSFYINIPAGFNYLLKKINVNFPAPGAPPVFQQIEMRLQVLGWGRVLANQALPLSLISTPGAGTVNGANFRTSYQNSKSIDFILKNKTSGRMIIENYTPGIVGNLIDIVLIGRAFRPERL